MKRKYKWTVRNEKLPKPIVLATRDEFNAWVAEHPELRNTWDDLAGQKRISVYSGEPIDGTEHSTESESDRRVA